MLNKIQLADIKAKAKRAETTNRDCMDLLEHIESLPDVDFNNEVLTVVERAIETSISSNSIVHAVERAVMSLKS